MSKIQMPFLSVYLLECLLVWVYPINIKTTEPVGPIFWVELRMAPGKVCVCSELQKAVFKALYLSEIKKKLGF